MENKRCKFYKVFLSFLLIISFTNPLLAKVKTHVTSEKKGQKYYIKNCSSCHGAGNLGGNMHSMDEWEELFSNNAQSLKELHIGEENTSATLEYLNSKKFKKQSKRMLKFLKEFAYDSDYIPTCN